VRVRVPPAAHTFESVSTQLAQIGGLQEAVPSDASSILVSMNRLSTEKRAQIIGCLTEGMSIRSTVRITGAAKNTITKLLVDLGEACNAYQHDALVDLPCTTLECDEIWNFVHAKDKNVPAAR
jgi:hypothetical protein